MQPQDLEVDYNDGVIKGDTKGLPNKGTTTGLNGDTYDADLSLDATNPLGKITGATKSQSPFDNLPQNPDD